MFGWAFFSNEKNVTKIESILLQSGNKRLIINNLRHRPEENFCIRCEKCGHNVIMCESLGCYYGVIRELHIVR